MENKEQKSNIDQPVVTYWLDFRKQMPNPMQEIFVLDKFGDIKPTINQGDWQKDYWVTNGYLWSIRPACR